MAVASLSLRLGLFQRALPVGTASVDLIGELFGIPKEAYVNQTTHQPSARADSSVSTLRFLSVANAALHLGVIKLSFEGGFQVGKDDKLPTIF